jgi:hypothetical protein
LAAFSTSFFEQPESENAEKRQNMAENNKQKNFFISTSLCFMLKTQAI